MPKEGGPNQESGFEQYTPLRIGDRVVSKVAYVDGKRDTTPAKVVEMQWGYDGSEAAREQGFVCVKVLSDATDVWKGASEAERRSSWVDAKNYDKI